MRTRIAAALLCLLLALTLAGCVHADRAVTLNSDGTGVYTFTVGLSAQMMSLGGSGLTSSMNAFGEQVKQDGGSYSQYDDSGYTYWKYVRPFTSVQQLDGFLTETPQSAPGANGASGANPDTQNTVYVAESAGFFRTTFHVTGHLSLALPNADQAARDLLKDARESFAVTMPGWVSGQSGGSLSGDTVTYTVHAGESATIDVTGGGFNVAHIALVAGGALLAVALVIVGLILVMARGARRRKTPALVDATSPYYLPTQLGSPAAPGNDEPTYPATPGYPRDYPRTPPPLPTPTPE